LEISKPTIHLDFSGEKWTNNYPVTISGFVSDQQYVHQIQINQIKIPIESARKKISFKKMLYLNDGKHHIHINAQNLMGGRSEKKCLVYVDRSGPMIIIKQYQPGERLAGQLMDQSNEYRLFVNETEIAVSSGEIVDFEYLVAIQRYVLKHAKQFKVMEKKDLDVILEELIQSSEKPESCIFLPEFHIFHGYIQKASTIFLYMKLTDKVGEVIDIAFESFSSEQLYPKLDKVISPFMDKLINQHPLQGVIVDIKGDQYVLNIGSAVGVDFTCEFKVQGIKDDVKLAVESISEHSCIVKSDENKFQLRKGLQVFSVKGIVEKGQ